MSLLIELEGDKSLEETTSLKSWIEKERIHGIENIKQNTEPPQPGEMGPTVVAVISVILSSAATVELIRSLHVWVTTRKRRLKVKITDGSRTVEIDCESPDDINALIEATGKLNP